MDLISLRDVQAAWSSRSRILFPWEGMQWASVPVKFPFPPRSPPQPRSPIGLNTMPDCAPILGNLKTLTEMYHFFYPRLLRAQIYLIGRAKNRPTKDQQEKILRTESASTVTFGW